MNLSLTKNRKKYVFDTSALITLFEKCQLREQLLKFAQKNELYVPFRVMEEYFAHGNMQGQDVLFQKVFMPIKIDLAIELLPYFNFDSTSGEIWVISYALKNRSSICVIDEEFSRNICKLFAVNITGTIGVISEMKGQSLLSVGELHQIRDKIRKSRFYLSEELCDELDKICLL